MEETKYIWMDGKFVDWKDAKVHVLSHAFHYGSAVFEGIRFYETPKGSAIFRLKEHTDRLFSSAEALEMDIPFSKEVINQATIELLQKIDIPSGYIRPLIAYGYGKMGLNPKGALIHVSIAAWPWPSYLGKDAIKAKISKYMRIHPDSSITSAKISGHYVNSILASQEVHNAGFDEAILLDYKGNIAEGPAENIFMLKDGTIYTPPFGTILKGLTRSSVMTIAKDLGYEIIEKDITVEALKAADEVFMTGTAAEVTAIEQVDDDMIANGGVGEHTAKIKEVYLNAVNGKEEKYDEWLTYIKLK